MSSNNPNAITYGNLENFFEEVQSRAFMLDPEFARDLRPRQYATTQHTFTAPDGREVTLEEARADSARLIGGIAARAFVIDVTYPAVELPRTFRQLIVPDRPSICYVREGVRLGAIPQPVFDPRLGFGEHPQGDREVNASDILEFQNVIEDIRNDRYDNGWA